MATPRVGVIGTGFAANTLLPLLRSFGSEVAIVALCGGRDTRKSASLAAKYAVPLCTQDFREVVDAPELDVLFVASPHARHYESVHYASRKACHVICEKPLALTTAQIDELVSMNAGTDHLRLVSHQLRFHPTLAHVKTLLADGRIGRPLNVSLNYETDRYITNGSQRRWWFESAEGGGMLLAVGTHLVDLVAYLFDEIPNPLCYWSDTSEETMKSLGYPGLIDTEAAFHATLRVRSDVLVDIHASGVSHAQDKGFQLRIRGTDGELRVGPNGELNCDGPTRGEEFLEARTPDLDEPVFRAAYRPFVAGVIDLIKGRRSDSSHFPTFASYGACHAVLKQLRRTDGNRRLTL